MGFAKKHPIAWLKNLLCWSSGCLSISLSPHWKPAENNRWFCFSWILSENNSSQEEKYISALLGFFLPRPCLEECEPGTGRAALWFESTCLQGKAPLPLNCCCYLQSWCKTETNDYFPRRNSLCEVLITWGAVLPSETLLTLAYVGLLVLQRLRLQDSWGAIIRSKSLAIEVEHNNLSHQIPFHPLQRKRWKTALSCCCAQLLLVIREAYNLYPNSLVTQ